MRASYPLAECLMSLLILRNVSLGFGGPPVLEEVNLRIERGEHIGLLGRNGSGKTSLLRVIDGQIEPDAGEVVRQQGLKTALLDQAVPGRLAGTVFEQVAGGLGRVGQLVGEYHAASRRVAAEGTARAQAELARIEHELESAGGWSAPRRVDEVLSRMQLAPEADLSQLSAGWKRRVLLARALASEPDLLLLDEPTNHLDIASVEWLEQFLLRYEGTLLFVTHDRVLLGRLANRIIDLDRGKLSSWSCDYRTYLARKEAALAAEAKQAALFDKRLAQEEVWIRQGIQARRTRNEGRVRALRRMRTLRAQRRDRPGEVQMEIHQAERSGRLVIEAKGVSLGYGDRPVLRDVSTLILRGDRVGILGPNGSGKTTLLRGLLGQLAPMGGTLRHGTNLEIAYFDQLQEQLDPEKSVQENVSPGTDTVLVGGQRRHVVGYLEQFLFTSEQARRPTKFLSGGEHNRLLLARLFTRPSNVLVLDEPTNDLDVETLELLEELLLDYTGTLLVVSHDRAFINNVVTSTLVLEGEGRVKEYAGGYDDWLRQRGAAQGAGAWPWDEQSGLEGESDLEGHAPSQSTMEGHASSWPKTKKRSKAEGRDAAEPPPAPRRLTYHEKRELETLPGRIESLESELARLHEAMAEPEFYKRPREAIAEATASAKRIEAELAETYARWEQLEGLTGK